MLLLVQLHEAMYPGISAALEQGINITHGSNAMYLRIEEDFVTACGSDERGSKAREAYGGADVVIYKNADACVTTITSFMTVVTALTVVPLRAAATTRAGGAVVKRHSVEHLHDAETC